jgi:hypothetical protein
MTYAFWIAILTVFIAVVPAIILKRRREARAKDGQTPSTTDTAGD